MNERENRTTALILAVLSAIIISGAIYTQVYYLIGIGVMQAVMSINSAIYSLKNDKPG